MLKNICYYIIIGESVIACISIVIYLFAAERILDRVRNLLRSPARIRRAAWRSRIILVFVITPVIITLWPEISSLIKAIKTFLEQN